MSRAPITIAVTAALTLAIAAAARAAVEHDGDSHRGDFGVSRLAFDGTIGPGDDRYLLLAITTSEGAPAVKTVTFDGVALGFISGANSPGAHCRIEWWGLVAPPAGTHSVVVDLVVSTGNLGATFLSYRGVSPVRPVGPLAVNAGTGASAITVTGAASGDVVLDGVCAFSPDSILMTAGDLQIGRWHWSSGSLSSAGSERPGAPGVTMTWTAGGSGNMEWAATGLALLAADGTGGRGPQTANLDVGTAGCALGHGRSPPPLGPASGIVVLAWLGLWARVRRRP